MAKGIQTWKKFEDTELTHSGIHHLMAIHDLRKNKGYARSVDVAKHLGISRGSTSITLRKLKERGYLVEDENKFYELTDLAKKLINDTLATRRVVEKFFREILEITPSIANEDACKIEHLISHETAESLLKFMGYFLSSRPEVEKFREGFARFAQTCQTSVDCQICETECFFNHDDEEELD